MNTWAAYQCYGDPDWVFRRTGSDANQFTAPLAENFSGVASAQGLKLALERIVVETRFQGADPATQLNNLSRLEERFKGVWGRSGDVAELFGEAFVEAGDVSHGLAWYESAVAAPDGRASMKAAEQLASVRGRLAWEVVDRARRHLQKMEKRRTDGDRTSKGRAAARRARAHAERTLRSEIRRADRLIERALALLAKLQSVEETMERASLIGSCYKRRALVDAAAGRRQRMRTDLQQMKSRYRHAQAIGAKRDASDLYYPASNCLVADVALHAGSRGWRGLDRDLLAIVQRSLETKSESEADFWSVAGEIELRQYQALAEKKLAAAKKNAEDIAPKAALLKKELDEANKKSADAKKKVDDAKKILDEADKQATALKSTEAKHLADDAKKILDETQRAFKSAQAVTQAAQQQSAKAANVIKLAEEAQMHLENYRKLEADARMRQLPHPLAQRRQWVLPAPVVRRRPRRLDHPARAARAHLVSTRRVPHHFALLDGFQNFF